MSPATDHPTVLQRSLTGELTIYHAAELKDQLLSDLGRSAHLELDLSQVTAVDTAGMQLLILLKRETQACGQELTIVAHSPAVRELIEFYNLAVFFGDPLVIPARNH